MYTLYTWPIYNYHNVTYCGCFCVGAKAVETPEPRLSQQLVLDELWDTLSVCLTSLAKMPDSHAVLVLQPTVEAFFLVHAGMYF